MKLISQADSHISKLDQCLSNISSVEGSISQAVAKGATIVEEEEMEEDDKPLFKLLEEIKDVKRKRGGDGVNANAENGVRPSKKQNSAPLCCECSTDSMFRPKEQIKANSFEMSVSTTVAERLVKGNERRERGHANLVRLIEQKRAANKEDPVKVRCCIEGCNAERLRSIWSREVSAYFCIDHCQYAWYQETKVDPNNPIYFRDGVDELHNIEMSNKMNKLK